MRWPRRIRSHITTSRRLRALLRYRAEVDRGIVHTQRQRERMEDLQLEFNQWVADTRRRCPDEQGN